MMKLRRNSIIILALGGLLVVLAGGLELKFHKNAGTGGFVMGSPDVRIIKKVGNQVFAINQYPVGSMSAFS